MGEVPDLLSHRCHPADPALRMASAQQTTIEIDITGDRRYLTTRNSGNARIFRTERSALQAFDASARCSRGSALQSQAPPLTIGTAGPLDRRKRASTVAPVECTRSTGVAQRQGVRIIQSIGSVLQQFVVTRTISRNSIEPLKRSTAVWVEGPQSTCREFYATDRLQREDGEDAGVCSLGDWSDGN